MSQTFPDVPATDTVRDSRQPLLDRDAANQTNFSGPTAPSVPVEKQFWHDTTTGFLKQYRGGVWRVVEGHPPAETVTALKALSAAEIFGNNALLWVIGDAIVGDCTPFAVKWNSASNATNDDYAVFRPSAGAAASGSGRWLRAAATPGIAFANSDATPDVKNARFCTTAATPPGGGITDFDNVAENHFFTVQRGSADCLIVHNASLIDLGGANITLTTTQPRLTFLHVNGVHLMVAGSSGLALNANLSDLPDPLTARRNIGFDDGLRSRTRVVQTAFPGTSLPTGFTNAGTWSLSNGATTPTTGGWNKGIYFDQDVRARRRIIRARFTHSNASGIHGIATRPGGSSLAHGTALIVDVPAGELKIYKYYDDNTGTLGASVALGFSMVTGREYDLEATIDHDVITFTIYDTKTGAKKTLTAAGSNGSGVLCGWLQGKAGLLPLSSGAYATYKFFEDNIGAPQSPHAIVIGDSNLLGTQERLGSGNAARGWGCQFEKARAKGDTLVVAMGGDSTALYTSHLPSDLWLFRPRYVVLCLGTNDLVSAKATWRTNVTVLKQVLATRGVELVLVTIPPRTGYATEVADFNADIRGGYFGYDVRYIDFAYALSASNDGTTINSSYDSGDGLHYNAAGHDAMFAAVCNDAPYLLNDANQSRVHFDAGFDYGMTLANGTDATNDIDFAAGQRLASTRDLVIYGVAMTKQLDATFVAGSAAGGRDPNYSIANGTWFVFALGRAHGYNGDYFFTQSLTPTLPAPFTHSRYIGSFLRESAAIVAFTQNGKRFDRTPIASYNPGFNPGTSALDVTLHVPLGLTGIEAIVSGSIGAADLATASHMLVSAKHQADTVPAAGLHTASMPVSAVGVKSCYNGAWMVNTAGQIRMRLSFSDADTSIVAATLGWVDHNIDKLM